MEGEECGYAYLVVDWVRFVVRAVGVSSTIAVSRSSMVVLNCSRAIFETCVRQCIGVFRLFSVLVQRIVI